MADVTQPRSNQNNGTATPATPGSITAVAGDLLIVVITAVGTSPTIAVPTSAGTWTTIQNVAPNATITMAMFMQANNGGGAINPSSVLGGTVTGWVATIFEFTQTGANCGLQGSKQGGATSNSTADIVAQVGQTIPNLLFVYAIGRQPATFTPNFTGLGPSNTSGWSASVQPISNIQGISADFYWGSNLAQGVGPWPTVPGSLSASVTHPTVVAWLNTTASQPGASQGSPIGGAQGIYNTSFQGMSGG